MTLSLRVGRAGAAALAAAAAVGAVVAGFTSVPRLRTYPRQVGLRALLAPARHEHLDAAPLAAALPRMRRGTTWWLSAPHGPSVGLTSEGGVYRSYATYLFLPAFPATSPPAASAVVVLGRTR